MHDTSTAPLCLHALWLGNVRSQTMCVCSAIQNPSKRASDMPRPRRTRARATRTAMVAKRAANDVLRTHCPVRVGEQIDAHLVRLGCYMEKSTCVRVLRHAAKHLGLENEQFRSLAMYAMVVQVLSPENFVTSLLSRGCPEEAAVRAQLEDIANAFLREHNTGDLGKARDVAVARAYIYAKCDNWRDQNSITIDTMHSAEVERLVRSNRKFAIVVLLKTCELCQKANGAYASRLERRFRTLSRITSGAHSLTPETVCDDARKYHGKNITFSEFDADMWLANVRAWWEHA